MHTHTHTHTHTHVGFYGLRGLSIGVMVFILYKLYVLLPYTNPTPKLSPHRRLCQRKQRIALYIILGHYSNMVLRHVPTNTYYIYIYIYSRVHTYLIMNWVNGMRIWRAVRGEGSKLGSSSRARGAPLAQGEGSELGIWPGPKSSPPPAGV